MKIAIGLTLCLAACSGFKEFDGGESDDVVTEGGLESAADVSTPPDTTPDSGLFPATCMDVHRLMPAAADGTFTLYVSPTQPWQAYCHDLAGLPAEYLTVANSGTMQNFAQYTAGGIGTSVRTVYQRIRIDPTTLIVSTGDQRFATTTGMLDGVPSMPYAMAADCNAAQTGLANIDLRGTPFAVITDGFTPGGFNAGGTATYSNGGQVVDLVGGGYCGWIAPLPGTGDLATALRGTTLRLVIR